VAPVVRLSSLSVDNKSVRCEKDRNDSMVDNDDSDEIEVAAELEYHILRGRKNLTVTEGKRGIYISAYVALALWMIDMNTAVGADRFVQ
jgi:hypothetical protein